MGQTRGPRDCVCVLSAVMCSSVYLMMNKTLEYKIIGKNINNLEFWCTYINTV